MHCGVPYIHSNLMVLPTTINDTIASPTSHTHQLHIWLSFVEVMEYSTIQTEVDYVLATITVAVLMGSVAVNMDISCRLWRGDKKYRDSSSLELSVLMVISWLYTMLVLPMVFIRFATHQWSFEGTWYAVIRSLQGAFILCYVTMMVSRLLLHCIKMASLTTYSQYKTRLRIAMSVVHCLTGSIYFTISIALKCFTYEGATKACSYIDNSLWHFGNLFVFIVLAILYNASSSDRQYLSFCYSGFILYDMLSFSYGAATFFDYVTMSLIYFVFPGVAIVINTASMSGFDLLETSAVSIVVSVGSYLLYMILLVVLAVAQSWWKTLLVSFILIKLGIIVLSQVLLYFSYNFAMLS